MAITLDGSDNKIAIGANATGSAYVRLYEDTDNGTNYVDIIAPASITSNRTLTLPDNSGTIITSGSTTGIDASAISTGTVATARLATGTANNTTYLRGDQTWAAISGGVTSVDGASGAVTLADLAAFGRSISSSGYQKLPGGLIIQWVPIADGATQRSVSWAIAFPTQVRGIAAGLVYATASYLWPLQIQSYSTSGVNTYSYNGYGGFVIAIGN